MALNFTATSSPTTGWKYWTTNTITTTGNINLSNNKLYSQTSIKLQSGFKATSTGNKIIAGVGGCSSSVNKITIGPSSVKLDDKESFEENKIILFPNPVINGEFYIQSTSESIKYILIFDSSGKNVMDINTFENLINVSNLSSGVYLIHIVQDEISTSKKLIIE